MENSWIRDVLDIFISELVFVFRWPQVRSDIRVEGGISAISMTMALSLEPAPSRSNEQIPYLALARAAFWNRTKGCTQGIFNSPSTMYSAPVCIKGIGGLKHAMKRDFS